MNEKLVRSISSRMSLRTPQAESLGILANLADTVRLSKTTDVAAALEQIKKLYPQVEEFEREFPSLCFALATGVGKTRLMGAFIAYLHLAKGMNNFFVLAPNLTIYNKLIIDFTPNTPKYVFQGIGEFVHQYPNIITGDNYNQGQHLQSGALFEGINVNIFNISKINSEVRGGKTPRIKRLSEYIGQSYFDYLVSLPDLTLIMDESHRYRATAGVRVLNELKPVLGLELTATPQVEAGAKSAPFKNVIYSYPLYQAMQDGFVKEPAVATRENFNADNYTEAQLERLKLEDGILVHEETKVELEVYAREHHLPIVKPFALIVAVDTEHAKALLATIEDAAFFGGKYKGKVITVHSNQRGEEKDETIEQLMSVEKADNPVEIVIHVNMLKEGWDVTNLYTIIPLRAANSRTLVEQSIGRGLRLPYGKRTGVEAVDRLTIIAHDHFQTIIDEARDPNSIIRRGVLIGRDVARAAKQVVTAQPVILQTLAGTVGNEANSEGTIRPVATPLFQSEETQTAQVVYDIVRELEHLPSSRQLANEEVRQYIVTRATDITHGSTQGTLIDDPNALTMEKEQLESVVERVVQAVIEKTIDIPRIVVQPKGEVTWGYEDFELEVSGIQLQPVSEELLVQHLRNDQRLRIHLGSGVTAVQRLEDYLVFALMEYSDISYDDHADLLYKLSGEVVQHLQSYLSTPEDVANVLQYNQQRLAELIHIQMKQHYYERATEYEVRITKGFTTLKSNTYAASEAVRDFRQSPADLRNMSSLVFGGFLKCLYPQQKFDSDAERRFAVICENDPSVRKWFKPAKGQLQIHYRSDQSYEPDFVVETETEKILAETKAANEVASQDVQDKAAAAIQWCKHATAHELAVGGKSWRYILVPHTSVQENMTIQGLAATFTMN